MTRRQSKPHPVIPQNNQRPKFLSACRRRESRSELVVLRKDVLTAVTDFKTVAQAVNGLLEVLNPKQGNYLKLKGGF